MAVPAPHMSAGNCTARMTLRMVMGPCPPFGGEEEGRRGVGCAACAELARTGGRRLWWPTFRHRRTDGRAPAAGRTGKWAACETWRGMARHGGPAPPPLRPDARARHGRVKGVGQVGRPARVGVHGHVRNVWPLCTAREFNERGRRRTADRGQKKEHPRPRAHPPGRG